MRAFVDAEIDADAMTRPMLVIEPGLPERVARQNIKVCTSRPFREAHGGERDMALQHERVMLAHVIAGLADGHGAGDVRGTVQILAAGIH